MLPRARILPLVLLSVPATAAAADKLDLKTGQWEMTATVHMQGPVIPPEALAAMPPGMRDHLQAALQAAMQPHTSRTCMTEEKLRRGFDVNQDRHGDCRYEPVSVSAGRMELRGTCQSEDGGSTMHAELDAIDRTSLHGTVTIDRAGAATPHHIDVELNGHFLAPACKDTGDD